MGEDRLGGKDARDVGVVEAQLDRLSWLIGATFDALERLEWTRSHDALSRFINDRQEARMRAMELPIVPTTDGRLDLSRLPEETRVRATQLIARAGGLFLGYIKQDVVLREGNGLPFDVDGGND
jgi:hypothetical protein